jgi:hypothetical protein
MPLLVVLLAVRTYLARDSLSREDVGVLLAGLLVSAVVVIAVLAWWRLRTRRARRTPGALWTSGSLTFIGPAEYAGGLPGANSFLQKHTSKSLVSAAPVKVVLTDESMMIFSIVGRGRDTLACPLETITQVEIVHGTRKERGFSLTTAHGGRASFTGKVEDSLAKRLAELGARPSFR